ncbi:MAG: Dabb family protein [Clostridia bacterium]|nr:Dabb family protein [Clostridia bacterium]
MKHLILVKWNEKVQDITAFCKAADEHFKEITEVEGVQAVRTVEGIRQRDNRYHLMIEIDMEKDALKAYDASRCHHEWKGKFGPFIEKKTIFDYE